MCQSYDEKSTGLDAKLKEAMLKNAIKAEVVKARQGFKLNKKQQKEQATLDAIKTKLILQITNERN